MTALIALPRRRHTGSALFALALALASPAAAADLVISNWDGYMAPDAMAAFKTATGVSGEVVVHATNEEIMGKLVASGGKGYDVVFIFGPLHLGNDGALLSIRYGEDRADLMERSARAC